jgi:hypothetical protein
MTRHLPIRLAISAALAGSALAVVAIPTGVAGAAVQSVSCAATGTAPSLSPTGTDALKYTGCTGTGAAATGATGSGTVKTTGKQPTGTGTDTIKWKSGKTSSITFSYKETEAKATVTAKCKKVTNDTALAYVTQTGTVKSGTALVGSKVSGNSCVYTTKTHSLYEAVVGKQAI